jgi:SpoVK/Ycf46/Vps4 family AAA+-type ATPase
VASQLNGQVERLVTQFSLSAPTIHAACVEAATDDTPRNAQRRPPGPRGEGDLYPKRDDRDANPPPGLALQHLWDACRMQARPRLDNLAQRIEPAAGWDDLVLPEPQRSTLREIASHVRNRATVYESWGFGSQGARGLGISALFAGASGTGKTMAAEVLAGELRLDLYRIDLSAVVSKYIGETEKNLRRVFDAAEEGGVILLFDEADALFGKRSEVKDSHDRYANIEVSYLLQRMEAYRGLAILTTNMKQALDTAFLRRIRFIVQFPFPDAAQRARIWNRIFPATTPTDGLDAGKLSRLNVAGGHIRNIALGAAFVAADASEPVRMHHVLRAARSEYAKLEKPLTDSEIGGWT